MLSDIVLVFQKNKKRFITKSVKQLKNKECKKRNHKKSQLHTKVFQVCISVV